MPDIALGPKLSLHYLDENPRGPAGVVLLHGLGASCQSWALQIPALCEAGFRVIAPDLRGFGSSTYPGGGFRIEDMAADVISLLTKIGLEKTSLVGISMGGSVAVSLICDYAQFFDKALLVNTFARLRPANPTSLFYYSLRFLLIYTLGIKTQANTVARHIFPRPEQEELRRLLIEEISQADPSAYRAAFTALARFNRMACLSQIRTPTLLITATNDTTVPPVYQRHLVEGIPGARQVIIPDAGHAVIVDQPQAFNQTMMDFILNVQPVSRPV